MIETYRLIWDLLNGRERRNFVLLTLLSIVLALFELIGIASILPFLTVLARPEIIRTNEVLIGIADTFALETDDQVMVALGAGVLILIVTGMVVRAWVTYLQIRFSLNRSLSIAQRQLHGYLQQDYSWFLSRNSAELSQSLLSEIDAVVRESILPAVLIVSNFIVLALVAALVFAVEPVIAVAATGLLVATYMIVYAALRSRMTQVGKARVEANRERFHVVQEVTGGIKELKVMGLEAQSLQRFRGPSLRLVTNQSRGLLMNKLPRFALEAVIYGGFIAMLLILIVQRGSQLSDLIPTLGLIAMAGTKMFPALQQIYQQMAGIRTSQPALRRLHASVTGLTVRPMPTDDPAPLRLTRELALDDLTYRYPGAERDTLRGFSATIPARTTLGIVGGTGAGKTTLVDIVLGLLTPDRGEVRVDGAPITPDRVRAWQKSLGYVPQFIFLADDTVAGNIAFGTSPDRIDMGRVERAARTANLHDFVTSDLPEGYRTRVGERGVRLSGGQRQRIGIARALYRDPDVLILDEATSALDNLTERAVMEAVHNLGGQKTIIMIAHRLSTVIDCDVIFYLEGGRLAARGTYRELVGQNEAFRRMAGG